MLYYFLMIGGNIVLTFLCTKLDKKLKINFHLKQLLSGLMFGIMGIIATQEVHMVSIPLSNVRDSFTVTAGLLFGGEAGIISGVISALFRFFSPTIIGGEFTRISCTITVLVAGFASAIMRKWFFNKRCPTLLLAFLFSITVEALHMAMIFITHSTDLASAFSVVREAVFKVMSSNSISVMLSVLVFRLTDMESFKQTYLLRGGIKGINKGLIWSLGFFLILSFFIVGLFLYFTHTRYSENSLRYVLDSCISEVQENIDCYGENVCDEKIIEEIDNYSAYMIDDLLLVDKDNGRVYNHPSIVPVENFMIEASTVEGKLYESELFSELYYYMYRPFGNYYIVALVLSSDITFFRDSTICMVGLLNVIIFSILFFVAYILLKKFVISNLRRVIEQTMRAKGEDITIADELAPKYFMPISEELNYTFRLLYKNNTELTGKIKEEKAKKEKAEYLACHDDLTGIYNREGFSKMISCYKGLDKKNIAFVFIDVDKFKSINDTYGHQVGDKILQKISYELAMNSRSDDILMRYGGDEFAMILMGCTRKEEDMINKKIININNALTSFSDDLPSVTISAGCAFSVVGYNKEVLKEAVFFLFDFFIY